MRYNTCMTTHITKEEVYEKLSRVIDPELYINIVELGLIYDVRTSEPSSTKASTGEQANKRTRIEIVMTLTTPGCPLAPVIDRMVKEAVSKIEGVEESDVTVELEWDPPWTKDMMSEEAKLTLGF